MCTKLVTLAVRRETGCFPNTTSRRTRFKHELDFSKSCVECCRFLFTDTELGHIYLACTDQFRLKFLLLSPVSPSCPVGSHSASCRNKSTRAYRASILNSFIEEVCRTTS
ncbi:hypothetical protein RRG08_044677 [Elysia crispata]|uniref:Uncharacterized protein n=1 Tax=Elysia crispata TaxID=231223 RepID=A0AAE1A023_9GAST|nr:hypothetical protein RRG08_044677 [Elysia crispata]